ncbi:hypothetical protein ACCO40_10355 [Bacillus spizizenii]|uniref:hypothetical protein n=1 Tax=Bacillus spizizenii TaxID=96241 RepID=UPI000DEFB91A|nr:hypothetical protein [Bacillus spizizenii]
MKLKRASVFILAIVLIELVSIYLTNTQKEIQDARRGHTASIGYFTDGHSYEIWLVEAILLKYVLSPLKILKGVIFMIYVHQ